MDDPRLTPARPEVAAKYLEGKVTAARFAEGEMLEVTEAIAPVRRAPASDAEQLTQALRGERVTVYDRNGEGFAWGQLGSDGYVGWLPESALTKRLSTPTHKVTALWTFAFAGPSIKTPPALSLPMGAVVEVGREHDSFAVIDDGYYVPRQHLGPLDARAADFVAVAERFVGTPYLWGGKSAFGIDCSGLVQVSLTAAGTGCPRDSDMQCAGLGRELSAAESKHLKHGDLIFWKGHVAIARDAETIVHANAHHMATVIEKTKDAIARIKAGGSEVVAIKRL
ncbi:C40 family peptidase [Bradyrhizobium sp.]|uniref:C40 family peptidase n=1 Tax=Bradyrhizobium sp. TaxID=376 RepID=UPI00403798AC